MGCCMNDVIRTSNERATFEQWAQKRGFTLEVNGEGVYLNTHTLDAWSAWEAALQTTECGIRNGQYRYCDGHWRDKSNRSSGETIPTHPDPTGRGAFAFNPHDVIACDAAYRRACLTDRKAADALRPAMLAMLEAAMGAYWAAQETGGELTAKVNAGNAALTCDGACKYDNYGRLDRDPRCSTHGQKATPETCERPMTLGRLLLETARGSVKERTVTGKELAEIRANMARYFKGPLRFREPQTDSDGPLIDDADGNPVAMLYWPCHPVEETTAAEQATYELGRAMAAALEPTSEKAGASQVGCERDDGLLNVHPETEVCEVCRPKAAPPTPVMQARFCDYKGPRVERDGRMVCPECGNE
jgi:hypothetical protein